MHALLAHGLARGLNRDPRFSTPTASVRRTQQGFVLREDGAALFAPMERTRLLHYMTKDDVRHLDATIKSKANVLPGDIGRNLTIHSLCGGATPDMLACMCVLNIASDRTKDLLSRFCRLTPPANKIQELMNVFLTVLHDRLQDMDAHHKVPVRTASGWDTVISIAAFAHDRLTWIHPYDLGNGRTARWLANTILRRYGLPCVPFAPETAYTTAVAEAHRQWDVTIFEAYLKQQVNVSACQFGFNDINGLSYSKGST